MIAIVLLIISSVIGAGFATGAELQSFFAKTNLHPALLAVIVAACMLLVMSCVLFLSSKDIRPPGTLFIPVYFIFFVAMTAGVGGMFGELSKVITLALCVMIVLMGFDKISKLNKHLISFALVALIVFAVINQPGTLPTGGPYTTGRTLGRAMLYAGLNCGTLFPVISNFRKRYSTRKIMTSLLIAAVSIGILVYIIFTATHEHRDAPLPMLSLSRNVVIISAVFISIFTSMIIGLFNLDTALNSGVARDSKRETKPGGARGGTPRKSTLKLIIICTLAFLLSLMGFTTIVDVVYPLLGISILLYIAFCFIIFFAKQHITTNKKEHAPTKNISKKNLSK